MFGVISFGSKHWRRHVTSMHLDRRYPVFSKIRRLNQGEGGKRRRTSSKGFSIKGGFAIQRRSGSRRVVGGELRGVMLCCVYISFDKGYPTKSCRF